MSGNWIVSRFLPAWHVKWLEIREDLAFNVSFLGMRGSQYLAKNLDYWVVGAVLGSASLGTYYIAYVLPNLLRRRMTSVVASPIFTTVASFAEDRSRVQRAYLEAVRSITLAAGPILIGMALLSDDLIRVAFGEKWLAAIEPMAILAVAAAINVIGPVGSAILTAIGKPARNIVVNLTWSAAIAVGLWMTIVGRGLTAVAFVVLAATIFSKVIQISLLRGPLKMQWRAALGALAPATFSLAVMAAVVLIAETIMGDDVESFVRAAVLVTIAAATYFAFGFLAFRSAFRNVLRDIKSILVGK
jgi:O-antigen/teichoic acid export membrane protein